MIGFFLPLHFWGVTDTFVPSKNNAIMARLVVCLLVFGMLFGCNQAESFQEKSSALDETSSVKDMSSATKAIADGYMAAMNSGDMDKMVSLMHDDMVWQNGGDSRMPWIGPWKGKKIILETFLPTFMENFKTTEWITEDAFASGDVAAYFGRMKGITTKSGVETKEFNFALRVKVKDGKVILWNWFEDSFEVSRAFNSAPVESK